MVPDTEIGRYSYYHAVRNIHAVSRRKRLVIMRYLTGDSSYLYYYLGTYLNSTLHISRLAWTDEDVSATRPYLSTYGAGDCCYQKQNMSDSWAAIRSSAAAIHALKQSLVPRHSDHSLIHLAFEAETTHGAEDMEPELVSSIHHGLEPNKSCPYN